MSAVGYGDRRPVAPNLSPEQKSINRRVEFVLENLNEYKEQLPYLIRITSYNVCYTKLLRDNLDAKTAAKLSSSFPALARD